MRTDCKCKGQFIDDDIYTGMESIRQRLTEERSALIAEGVEQRASTDPVELDPSRVGRLSRMDAIQMKEMAAASDRRRKARTLRIDAALARIEAEEYGSCLSCGEPIAPKRLELDPAASACIECAALERV